MSLFHIVVFFFLLAKPVFAQQQTEEIAYYKVNGNDTSMLFFRFNRAGITLDECRLKDGRTKTPSLRILIETDGRGGFYRIDPIEKTFRKLTVADYPRARKWLVPVNKKDHADTLVFSSDLTCLQAILDSVNGLKPKSFDRLAEFVWPGLRNAIEERMGIESAKRLPWYLGYAPVKTCKSQIHYLFIHRKEIEISPLVFMLQGDWVEDFNKTEKSPGTWPPKNE